jgi:hypothetical protein
MSPLKGRRANVVVLVVASLFGMGAVSLRAAGGNPLDAVLASLAAISTSVNAISNTLNPEPAEVLLATGLVRVAIGETVYCTLANVSDHSISVDARLLSAFDTATLAYLYPAPWPPGMGAGVGGLPVATTTFVRCEFRFTGFANEVRGTLNVAPVGGTATTVVVDAR